MLIDTVEFEGWITRSRQCRFRRTGEWSPEGGRCKSTGRGRTVGRCSVIDPIGIVCGLCHVHVTIASKHTLPKHANQHHQHLNDRANTCPNSSYSSCSSQLSHCRVQLHSPELHKHPPPPTTGPTTTSSHNSCAQMTQNPPSKSPATIPSGPHRRLSINGTHASSSKGKHRVWLCGRIDGTRNANRVVVFPTPKFEPMGERGTVG